MTIPEPDLGNPAMPLPGPLRDGRQAYTDIVGNPIAGLAPTLQVRLIRHELCRGSSEAEPGRQGFWMEPGRSFGPQSDTTRDVGLER